MKKLIFATVISFFLTIGCNTAFAGVVYLNDFEGVTPLVSTNIICTDYAISPTHCDEMTSSISSVSTSAFTEITDYAQIEFYMTMTSDTGFNNLRSSLDINAGFNLIGFWNDTTNDSWEIWDASQTYKIADDLVYGQMYHIRINVGVNSDDFSISTDGGSTWSSSYDLTTPVSSITTMTFSRNGGNGDIAIDDFIVYDELYTIETVGITSSTPENNATNVNAYTTFTGTYDNDGTYTSVWISYTNADIINDVYHLNACQVAQTGTNLDYSCNISLSTNTNYLFSPFLFNATGTGNFEEDSLFDSNEPYAFTTGLVYEVITPPVSSTCGTFEFGCHLESALSWFFGVNQNTLNQFSNLSLENAFPFSYLYDLGDLYDDAFNHTAQDIDIAIAFGGFGDITLLSTDKLEAVPFQGTVRTVLGAIMIFATTMAIYRKIIRIHDHEHKTV